MRGVLGGPRADRLQVSWPRAGAREGGQQYLNGWGFGQKTAQPPKEESSCRMGLGASQFSGGLWWPISQCWYSVVVEAPWEGRPEVCSYGKTSRCRAPLLGVQQTGLDEAPRRPGACLPACCASGVSAPSCRRTSSTACGGRPRVPQLHWAFWSQPHPSSLGGSGPHTLMPAFVGIESRAPRSEHSSSRAAATWPEPSCFG